MIKKVALLVMSLSSVSFAMEQRVLPVPTLASLSMQELMRTIFSQKDELNDFLLATCEDVAYNVFLNIVEHIITYNNLHKVYDTVELRLRLADCCISKSIADYAKINPQCCAQLVEQGDYLESFCSRPVKGCPYVMRAIRFIDELLADPKFCDKATIQPLATACLIGCTPLLVRGMLFAMSSSPFLAVHALKQLIAKDEEKALLLLKHMPGVYCRARQQLAEVFNLAELFNRPTVIDEIQTHEYFFCVDDNFNRKKLLPSLERLVCLGDFEKIDKVWRGSFEELSHCTWCSMPRVSVNNEVLPAWMYNKFNVLGFAVCMGYTAFVQFLFEKKVKIPKMRGEEFGYFDEAGSYTYHLMRSRDPKMLKLLISHGEIQELSEDELLTLTLRFSEDKHDVELLQLFINKCAVSSSRCGAILRGACFSGNLQLAIFILKKIDAEVLNSAEKLELLTQALGSKNADSTEMQAIEALLRSFMQKVKDAQLSAGETP